MTIDLRTADRDDEPFLWTMLVEAAHAEDVTDPGALRSMPELARYVEGWGRPTDLGVVAERDGRPVGAAWVRLLVGATAGYGYVDDLTPELAIAVAPDVVGQGVGTALLRRLLDEARAVFPAVCLSVRADNPARRLYARLGFDDVDGSTIVNRVGGTSLTMVHRFGGASPSSPGLTA